MLEVPKLQSVRAWKNAKMMCAIRDSNSGPSLITEKWEANVMTTKLRALLC